jgi:glyoxylase-like metal-dependent hydrolase (beta-lactamase superfamily II)
MRLITTSQFFIIIFTLIIGGNSSARAKEQPPITVKKINAQVYILIPDDGLGSNVGVILSDTGVLLIDAMNAQPGSPEKLDAALKSITAKPVKFIINTHSHRDHPGANAFYEKRGATIISQDNILYAKTNVENTLQYDNQWYVGEKLNMVFGDQPIVATTAISHTYNDLIIYLPNTNVVFMGDNFGTTWGPNGSEQADGVIQRAIDNIAQNTIVVPGHGHLTDQDHLVAYKENTATWFKTIYALADSGQSASQLLENKKIKRLVKFFSGNATSGGYIDPKNLVRRFQRTLNNRPLSAFPINDWHKYVGIYLLKNGDELEIYHQDGFTYARVKGQFVTELHPISNTRFDFLGWKNGEYLQFTLDANKKVSGVALIKNTNKETK